YVLYFFFQAEDGIRDFHVTGVQTCALPISTTIRRPRSEVYAFWRRLENLPRFMTHLDEVEEIDARHSHWRATAPFGRTVSWDARSEEHTSELQSRENLVCRLLLV